MNRISLKAQCEALVLAVAMAVSLLVTVVMFPEAAPGLVSASAAALAVMLVLRGAVLQSVGINLVPDTGKLIRLRRVLVAVTAILVLAIGSIAFIK